MAAQQVWEGRRLCVGADAMSLFNDNLFFLLLILFRGVIWLNVMSADRILPYFHICRSLLSVLRLADPLHPEVLGRLVVDVVLRATLVLRGYTTHLYYY